VVQRLILNLRMYSEDATRMNCMSIQEMTFEAAYGKSSESSLVSRSALASVMAAEELGGLLGSPNDEDIDFQRHEHDSDHNAANSGCVEAQVEYKGES